MEKLGRGASDAFVAGFVPERALGSCLMLGAWLQPVAETWVAVGSVSGDISIDIVLLPSESSRKRERCRGER